jgi:hypothetical protein
MRYLPGAIVVWLLACCWLLPPLHAQFRPQLCNLGDAGFCSRAPTTTACTAPSIDANANAIEFGDWSSGTSFSLISFLSSNASNVVVVLFTLINGGTTAATITPTDSAGLLSFGISHDNGIGGWGGTNRFGTDSSSSLAEYVSKSSSSSPLAGDTITITTNFTPTFGTAWAFVVDGVNLSSLFSGGSVPTAGVGSANAIVSTTAPCTMIVNGLGETGTATPSAPWTQILQRNFMFSQYARFTSAQGSFIIPQGSGGASNKAIGDALQSP